MHTQPLTGMPPSSHIDGSKTLVEIHPLEVAKPMCVMDERRNWLNGTKRYWGGGAISRASLSGARR